MFEFLRKLLEILLDDSLNLTLLFYLYMLDSLDKINAELSQNHNDIANAAAGMVFIAAHPNFDAESMHDYVLTSAILAVATDQFDSQIMDATQKLKELENQTSIVKGYLQASCDSFKGMENINKYAQDLIEEK